MGKFETIIISASGTIACGVLVFLLSAAKLPDPTTVQDLGDRAARAYETVAGTKWAAAPAKEIPVRAVDTSSAHYDLLSAIYGNAVYEESPHTTPLPAIDDATLWLARCIYSETKLPHEQELVAWVVRNRVETNYRGRSTYRGVVLDPYQFSGFNPGIPSRSFYLSLDADTPIPGWQQALSIAYFVRHADENLRPFSLKTRHFFSEISMPEYRFPYWVEGRERVSLNRDYTLDQRRFRFYEEIS